MSLPPVFSHYQIAPLLEAFRQGVVQVDASLDLGMSSVKVELTPGGVFYQEQLLLTWDMAQEIVESEASCFSLQPDGSLHKIQEFSEENGRYYSLMPTNGAPTMLISGIPMHRIKGIDPYHDTLKKIAALSPLAGRVLDTCTGLGYTAIQAARTAQEVLTIEFDPTVLTLARQNPWSQELFENPKITQWLGDSYERVPELADNSISRILHDPPTFSLAGQLYSGEFYRQLYRVLKHNGRLFHYIGDLSSASGARVSRGAVQRMQQAGFVQITARPEAFGWLALKR